MTSLHDGYFVPNRIGEGVYTISYELYDTLTTCYNKNVVPVRIARTPVQPNLYGGGPYCQGTELNNLRGDGLLSNTYKWYIWDEDDKEAALEEDSNYIPGVEDFVLLGAGNPFNFGELNTLPYEVVYGTQMSKYGCESGWSKLEIAVLPAPIAKFGAKDSIKEAKVPAEITFINQSEIGADSSLRELTYYWTFGPFGESIEENPTFTFNEIGKYVVTLLVDNTVCTDEYQYTIFLDRLVKFFIPNVFTPNGDKHNDVFDWELEGIKSEDFSLKIYNRWGTLVFETEDVNATWDGQDAFLGGDAPDGTYFYIVQGVEDTNEQEKAEYRGDLTLIRE